MPRPQRPSPSLVISVVALFVALGGPAQAAKLISGSQIRSSTITSKHIKNHSLKTVDLSTSVFRSLESAARTVTGANIKDGTITNADLADFIVGPKKLLRDAVGANALADNAVDSTAVLDGSLAAKDVTRFAGSFVADLPSIAPGTCEGLTPDGLAPQAAKADISADVIVGTPPGNFPDGLTFAIRRATSFADRPRIVACNPTAAAIDPAAGLFRYAVFSLPS